MALSEKDLNEASQLPTSPSQSKDLLADVSIYADGLCIEGFVGTGHAIFRGGDLSELWYGLHSSDSTSKLAELRALHHALQAAKVEIQDGRSVTIFSESEYAVWIVTELRTSKKLPRATPRSHAAIIQPSHELYVGLKDRLTIKCLKPSSPENKLAKIAASWAIDAQEQGLRRYSGPMEIGDILAFLPD